MFGSLIAFFSSTFFRLIWGEVSTWWTARQDHKYELERMRLQNELAQSTHQRDLERIKFELDHKVQLVEATSNARMGEIAAQGNVDVAKVNATSQAAIQEIQARSQAQIGIEEAGAFRDSINQGTKTTGIKWVDAWNAAIRAALATELMILIFLHYMQADWKADDRLWELGSAVFGWWLADRYLFRRNK